MHSLKSAPLHENTSYVLDIGTSRAIGREVYLKMECFQPVGSFKIRGIGLLCQRSLEQGKKRIVSSSGGNAGFAAAYAGRRLGMPVTVVVPESTPTETCNRLREQGAEVVVVGEVWDESDSHAKKLATNPDAAYIPPFDDPVIWEGHATLIDEIAQKHPKPDVVVVSVGGGGLMCGVVEGLRRNHWSDVRIVSVETLGAESLHQAVTHGKVTKLPRITSIAKSLGAAQVAQRAFDWTKQHPIDSVVVSDLAAVKACLWIADTHRVVVEPACGASLAVAYQNHASLGNARIVAVIVCGGINTSIGQLRQWAEDLK